MKPIYLLALLLLAGSATAQFDAYEATVPVPSQSAADRAPALRAALAQVLARVGGDTAAGASESILARAGALVQRYGYQRDEGAGLRLNAAFDPKAVDAALKTQGLPVFGVHAGATEDVTVSVTGLSSGADYARTIGALHAVPGVKSVAVLEAIGDRLLLRVRSEGGAGRLAGAAAIGGVLTRGDGAPDRLSFVLN